MQLKFTNHAQIRIRERGLSIEHVKAAMLSPDSTKPGFEGAIEVKKKVSNKKEIVVLYKKDGFRDKKETYIIITAYYI